MTTQLTSGKFTLDGAGSTVEFRNKTFWGLATVHGVFGSVLARIRESTPSTATPEVREIHIRVVGEGVSRERSAKRAKRGQ